MGYFITENSTKIFISLNQVNWVVHEVNGAVLNIAWETFKVWFSWVPPQVKNFSTLRSLKVLIQFRMISPELTNIFMFSFLLYFRMLSVTGNKFAASKCI